MRGYEPSSYGDGVADVYDEWFGTTGDEPVALERLAQLAAGGPVLELGVGTGRLAIPLAARGLAVTGIDVSGAMLDQLRAKPGSDRVTVVQGDMGEQLPEGPFGLVYAAANTFFNLTSEDLQQRCLQHVHACLQPGGHLVIDAFVPPDDDASPTSAVEVRSVEVDRVVLRVFQFDGESGDAFGQLVELSENNGVRLRPWKLHLTSPARLDALASNAGLVLVQRHASWQGDAFSATSTRHVSIYERDEVTSAVSSSAGSSTAAPSTAAPSTAASSSAASTGRHSSSVRSR
jgi:SAM-dependent methyltransferase